MRPFTLLTLLLPVLMHGQELVRNGGFEDHRKCPTRFDKKPVAGLEDVRAINGMPGYFHACSEVMGTPSNWAGTQAPYEGDAYAGLVLTAHGGNECQSREWLQLALERPLTNGGKYRVRFQVSLADLSGYMTDRIGIHFSAEDHSGKGGMGSIIGHAHVERPLNAFLQDTAAWMLVEGIYNARGGERYLVLGNLHPCDRSSRKALTTNTGDGLLHNMKKRGALDLDPDKGRALRRKLLAAQSYVYVDAVSVQAVMEGDAENGFALAKSCTDDPGAPPTELDLIPDPGFDRNEPSHASSWTNASGGTPDLMVGKCGIYLYSAVNVDHREFIHTPLKHPLDPCGQYALRLRILRDGSYDYAVDRIGVALVDHHTMDRRREVLPLPVAWTTTGGSLMDNTSDWTTLCATLDAPGCSASLVLGNFIKDDSTVVVQRDGSGGPFAYYFVDDVSLWRVGTVEGCERKCPCEEVVQQEQRQMQGQEQGQEQVQEQEQQGQDPFAEEVLIHFDVADHMPNSAVLDLVEQVRRAQELDPAAWVEVTGHTDASGTEGVNDRLSLMRAQAVRDALVQFGAGNCRVDVRAAGSREPVADNTTEAGRAANRRVEVRMRRANDR
ncbi:MAG TPA: OmpA family protein [Flavobacteriales bacterium]|jgi:outer membrane protein OmpA-like peptidoglycan-associated protein|nr:OmpA family protein [Flavobacteriales bacterium]